MPWLDTGKPNESLLEQESYCNDRKEAGSQIACIEEMLTIRLH